MLIYSDLHLIIKKVIKINSFCSDKNTTQRLIIEEKAKE